MRNVEMESEEKKSMWGRMRLFLLGFLVVIAVWQIIILKLLEKGIIGTISAMILICLGTAVILGAIFLSIKYVLEQLRNIMNGTAQEHTESSKTAEKIQKIAQRNDELGRLVRSLQEG